MFRNIFRIQRIIIRECKKSAVVKKSITIRQIDTKKISKAEQLKKQNFDAKVLFGSKKNEKKDNVNETASIADSGGVQSEIFWTLEHDADVKEVMIEKSKRTKKKKQSNIDSAAVKKAKPVEVPEKTPEAFARFKFDVPKPVKVTIRDVLDKLDTQINPQPIDELDQNEIPFNTNQLKEMITFPLVLSSNELIIDSFSNTVTQKTFIPTPSVSKVLQSTMSPSQRNALIQWKSLKIAELGLEGFEELQKSYLSRGKQFHECVQKHFDGIEVKEDDMSTDLKEIWHSVTPVLGNFKAPALFTEQYISHPYLHYKGYVDCVSTHNNLVTVIEWKNSDRLKKTISNTFDAPLQLCAYLAALNASEFRYKEAIKTGAIVVAYNDGQEADLFILGEKELNRYWKLWLTRLQEYWTRYRDKTLTDELI